MGPFLRGFADELLKLGGVDPSGGGADLSASTLTSSLNNTFKQPAMDVKKTSVSSSSTPTAPRVPKPDPVTTPTMMTDYRGSA